MSLPKINVPVYTMVLPSSNRKVSFRPYSVKEEKILLMAAESEDVDEMTSATRQIITNCVLEPDFDVVKLPIYDIDFAYMQIRAKSVGTILTNDYVCQNKIEGITCGTTFNMNIKIDEISFVDPKISNIIPIDDVYSVKMVHPSFEVVMTIKESDSDYEKTIKTLKGCIDIVFDANTVYKFSDSTEEEQNEFLEGLRKEPFDKMKEYVEKTPYFEVYKKHTCKKCGFNHEITIEDPVRFF